MQEAGVLCPYQLRTGKLLTGQVTHSSPVLGLNPPGLCLLSMLPCPSKTQNPKPTPKSNQNHAQVGYVIAGMRSTRQAQVGDTIFHYQHAKDMEKMPEPLPGFEKARAMLYAR